MYYLLRSGTAHDPHNGQFTSGPGGSAAPKPAGKAKSTKTKGTSEEHVAHAESFATAAAKHAALVKSEPHEAAKHLKNASDAAAKAAEHAKHATKLAPDSEHAKQAAGHAATAARHHDDAALQHMSGTGITHADLQASFSTHGLNARHTKTEILTDKDGAQSAKANFTLHDDTGKQVGWIEHSFGKDKKGEKFVKHDHIQLHESLQGKGYAKAQLKNSVEMYQKHNIDKIKLEAGLDAGRYVWAHMGFSSGPKGTAFYKDELKKYIKNWAGEQPNAYLQGRAKERGLSHEQAAAALAHIETHVNSMHDISEFKAGGKHIGKHFLLDAQHLPTWQGTMKLKDGEPGYEHFKKKLGL